MSGLMKGRTHTLEQLQAELRTRLRQRAYDGGTVWYLDLRGKQWRGLGTLVLHDPGAAGWPDRGRPTASLTEAQRWIDDRYAEWIQRQLGGQPTALTVAEAAEGFIGAMELDPALGPDHPTVSQRRSYLRVHIVPALGQHRLATVPRVAVQSWLDGMEVTKSRHGARRREPASRASRECAKAALLALFRHHFPGEAPPFAGVRIDLAKREAARRRELVRSGRGLELLRKRTYTRREVLELLATARYLDQHPEYGTIASWACRNQAPCMALQAGFASRIAEIVEVREQDVDETDGFVLIPGTKSNSAVRLVPLQDSVRPWLAILRGTKPADPHHGDFLIRTHPQVNARANASVYARRMAKVEAVAGLKLPQERSHIFRRTHASWAMARGVPPHELKMLLGHSGIYGGATDSYIQFIRELTRPEHRRYLDLPSPEEVDALLATGWLPPGLQKRRGGGAPEPRVEAVERPGGNELLLQRWQERLAGLPGVTIDALAQAIAAGELSLVPSANGLDLSAEDVLAWLQRRVAAAAR